MYLEYTRKKLINLTNRSHISAFPEVTVSVVSGIFLLKEPLVTRFIASMEHHTEGFSKSRQAPPEYECKIDDLFCRFARNNEKWF